jgi:hypothetical protein
MNGRIAPPVEYKAYLASREWAERVRLVRIRAGNVCERCCLRPVQEIHHLTYAHLGHEPLNDLLGLCADCHAWLSPRYGAQAPAVDPAPAWAASYGLALRARGLIASSDPVPCPDIEQRLPGWQAALPNSAGELFLEDYHIPLKTAQALGLGFVRAYAWPGSHVKGDVLVFPETNPQGRVVSLLGRHLRPGWDGAPAWSVLGPELWVQRTSAQGEPVVVPVRQRGYVGAPALAQSEPVLVTNDVTDMLALRAAGAQHVLALASGRWRWTWTFLPRRFYFTFNLAGHDPAKDGSWADFGTEAWFVGKEIFDRKADVGLAESWRRGDRRLLDDVIAAAR